MSRQDFLDAITRKKSPGRPAFGTGTSTACQDIMAEIGAWFPDAHIDATKMAALAEVGHTMLGFDAVMPLFSVCHEAAAIGCNVNWGGPNIMPESGPPIFSDEDDIKIPVDFIKRPGCDVPLKAISILKKRLGENAAVCGKVFGGWTQAYHYFGIENFLMMTLDDPAKTQRILDMLMPITIEFANAQISAGADCLLLADHATSNLCSPEAYERFLLPMHAKLAEKIDCSLILHICGNTADRIDMIAQTGLACFHWDTATGTPQEVRRLAGDKLALMGGVSNYKLLRGRPEEIANDVAAAIDSDIDVIGPECAIPLITPLTNLKAIKPLANYPL